MIRLLDDRIDILRYIFENPAAPDVAQRQAEADALLAEANQLAGGDPFVFLALWAEAEEERLITQNLLPSNGNTPPNPLRYVVNVNSPDGEYVLRGFTGPFGALEFGLPSSDTVDSIIYYDPPSRRVGIVYPFSSETFKIVLPEIFLVELDGTELDLDGDGLPDLVEEVYGTNPDNPDSDGDGISDGGEVELGTDPLDNLPTLTGMIASVDTPGTAQDVWTENDLAAVAVGSAGVSIFNIFNGMDPTLIAQVDTPGTGARVAGEGSLIAVADGMSGLAIIDIADITTAGVIHQLLPGTDVRAVVARAGTVFAGLADGRIAVVDMERGLVTAWLDSGGAAIADLLIRRDHLYALTSSNILTYEPFSGNGTAVAQVASPFPAQTNMRLVEGHDILYAVHGKGYNTFSLADPADPSLITAGDTGLFGWRDLADDGSGEGVAATGPNGVLDGTHNVYLYDVSVSNQVNQFLFQYNTPNDAVAVSVYNGIAYVVDYGQGLRVVNYRPADNQGMDPALAAASSIDLAGTPVVEEGAAVFVRATVTDDVKGRNVELYLDGERLVTEGSFPFEFHFTAPREADRSGTGPLELKLIGSDTGGNRTEQVFDVTLTPDTTTPTVVTFLPPDGSLRGSETAPTVHFNEAMDPASLEAAFTLTTSGGVEVAFTVDVQFDGQMAVFTPDSPLAPGLYTVMLNSNATDVASNMLAGVSWTFEVYDVTDDGDGDCIPDAVEPGLGLDPLLPDSDGDGIPDGDEDFDGDDLINCREIVIGSDPEAADTDGDRLDDGLEFAGPTDIFNPDSDGDGFLDGEEVESGSDPVLDSSVPPETTAPITHAADDSFGVRNDAPAPFTPLNTAVSPPVGMENQATSP